MMSLPIPDFTQTAKILSQDLYCSEQPLAQQALAESPPEQTWQHAHQPPIEDDEQEAPPAPKKAIARKGVKRPMIYEDSSSESEEAEELPDLASFFDTYKTPLKRRVTLCSEYARWIRALTKKGKE